MSTSAHPAPPPFVRNTTGTSYSPSRLAPNTTYYWSIRAKNSDGTARSATYRFTTVTPAPQNDRFSMATRISGRSGRARGSNVGAIMESGESGLGDKSVWWQWRSPSNGRVTIDTVGSSFDTILGVYTGTRVNALTRLAESDNAAGIGQQSRVILEVEAATVYWLRVSGRVSPFGRGGTGNIVLNWNLDTTMSNTPDFQDALFFADFVDGAGWSVQVAVSNNSLTRSLTGLIVFAGSEPRRPEDPPTDWDSLPRFTLPPGGTRIYTTAGTGPIVRGGVLVGQLSGFDPFRSETRMMSAVLTYRHSASGLEVTVLPLTADDLMSPVFDEEPAYAIFVEESQTVSVGLAVWKLTTTTEMCMQLVDLDGQAFRNSEGHDTICYAEKYGDTFLHSAMMLQEWFPSWDFSGGFQGRLLLYVKDNTVGRRNDGSLIPMGLRLSTTSMSALPVVPIALDQ